MVYEIDKLIKDLKSADLFLRNRTKCKPAPLNKYDINILQDIAKACNEAAEVIERSVVLPCKFGTTIYKIVKFCEQNTGFKEFYIPSKEFKENCPYYEPQCWEDYCEKCKAVDNFDNGAYYCSLNLEILNEKCKERLAIQKDVFTFSKLNHIYNTPMFNEGTDIEDICYLTEEEAKEALEKIKG